ncbi:hypothetical protein H072_11119 [Dactylellina haptotyla CBS 200.50]|uniref:F-box domain-containing protein n=1 Tax=Dactylellina haptotyla (strain CBS 200.50) TaxID=1284197 RepID=S7ZXR6_DACHA|nr:hypothetical protein H072_11119 [Dactylellina haptotyla CBS 200.50]
MSSAILLSLPTEILLSIFELATPQDLNAFSLCSKKTELFARPILFKKIIITETSIAAFNGGGLAHLKATVQHVSFGDTLTYDRNNSIRLARVYSDSICLFPNVSSIRITLATGNTSFDRDFEQIYYRGVFTILAKKSPTVYGNLKSMNLDCAIPYGNPVGGFRNEEQVDFTQLFQDADNHDPAAGPTNDQIPNRSLAEAEYPTKLEEITIRTNLFALGPKGRNIQSTLLSLCARTLKRLTILANLENMILPRDSEGRRRDASSFSVFPTLEELEIATNDNVVPGLYLDITEMFPNLRVLKVDGLSDKKDFSGPDEMVYSELMGLKKLRSVKLLWPGPRFGESVETQQLKMSIPRWIENGLDKLEHVEFWVRRGGIFNFWLESVECKVQRKGDEREFIWGESVNISEGFSREMIQYNQDGQDGWPSGLRCHQKNGVTFVL